MFKAAPALSLLWPKRPENDIRRMVPSRTNDFLLAGEAYLED